MKTRSLGRVQANTLARVGPSSIPLRLEFQRLVAIVFSEPNAPMSAGESKSSSITPNAAALTRSSPIAARWLSSIEVMIPPAHSASVLRSSLPVMSRTTSVASRTAVA